MVFCSGRAAYLIPHKPCESWTAPPLLTLLATVTWIAAIPFPWSTAERAGGWRDTKKSAETSSVLLCCVVA
ncbi:uncharacterized protein BJ171DRAFT_223530 [Polychytrium aggregatum]|uniref:uncharacterized protein n=1 Tax=Polychytrium aggregatum TaxID=110093 RepID=UPI0022FE1909|nr:uncharacterized protein BJ171DRAFT_223530 [Polychytrium aggregatum]KAI9197390.1 hypothetical protein BJ171DRAFT_223530 [Polychytrium aggregatum]